MEHTDIEVVYAGKKHLFLVGDKAVMCTDDEARVLSAVAMLQQMAPHIEREEAMRAMGDVYDKVQHLTGLDTHDEVQALLGCVSVLQELAEKMKNEGASSETQPTEVKP